MSDFHPNLQMHVTCRQIPQHSSFTFHFHVAAPCHFFIVNGSAMASVELKGADSFAIFKV
jgi:hypothetical protein